MTTLLSEPIESIITRFYGPPQQRRGGRSDRPWWVCPFHDDRNPSLSIVPGKNRYHCFGCGAHGDAIDFVRRLNPGMTFADAVSATGGRLTHEPPQAAGAKQPRPSAREGTVPRPDTWVDFARSVVEKAESVLWSDQGAEARSYLLGRGLREETIRQARIGYWPNEEWREGVLDDRVWIPSGIIIPWFDGHTVELISVRRFEGKSKYVAISGSRRGGIYPGASDIVSGKPIVIVEGEFDALLLKQELEGLASVVTLGSASCRPNPHVMNSMLRAYPWIVAADADDAGERSAEGWIALSERSIRIAPPAEFGKDWTDAHQNGLDLRPWWIDALRRIAGVTVTPQEPNSSLSTEEPGLVEEPSEEFVGFDVAPLVDMASHPWREDLAWMSDDWRLRWGGLANAYISDGMPWEEAEKRAASQVAAERLEAGDEPPPPMTPDPETAFWRDWLTDILKGEGSEERISPLEADQAWALLAEEPLNRDKLRFAVLAVQERFWTEHNRSLGLADPRDSSRQWRCENPFCRNKGRWWISAQGVVNCWNCRPPSFRHLVAAEGDASDAPLVESGRSHQAVSSPISLSDNLTTPIPRIASATIAEPPSPTF